MNLKKIVVATDYSENSLPALDTAFNLTLETTATLYLVHVIEVPATAPAVAPAVAPVEPPIEELREQAIQRLEDLIPEDWKKGVISLETVILVGTPSREIANFARQEKADMIIVGTHGRRGLSRILMGSTAETLLREAPCQVLVVKRPATETGDAKEG